jgi:formylglycine-generating enzyme required for sulfatase activity
MVIETVTVGNPGNLNDGTGHGSVLYTYKTGTYEVTAGQYCTFLNAKATTSDPYALYNPNMGSVVNAYGCNITRTPGPGAGTYVYNVPSDWANRPVNYVSFWDACRFVNWLHNGQGDGDTETGAYALNGYNGPDGRMIARNADAKWWVPSLDEWYKAAYHKNDGVTSNYWDYPTGTDNAPNNALLTPDSGNNANFQQSSFTIGAPYYRTDVGAFTNSASPYGTFDQGGNVWEWNDTLAVLGAGYSERTLRGGSFWFSSFGMSAANQNGRERPITEDSGIGFRVASVFAAEAVPEPSTVVTLLLGAIGVLAWKRRKATA